VAEEFQTPDPYLAAYLAALSVLYPDLRTTYLGVCSDEQGRVLYSFDDPLRHTPILIDVFFTRNPELPIRNYQAALTRLRSDSKTARFKQRKGGR